MIDNKSVMQQALDVLLSYNVEEFGAGQDVVAALRAAIVQPEQPIQELAKALATVMSWIDNWSPSFTDDQDWAEDENFARTALKNAIAQPRDKTMTDQKINTLWADALKYANPTAGNAHLIFARSLLAQPKETE